MAARTALLIDFDNVFISLWELDRDAALRFASEPGDWLQVLANTYLAGEPRRWLITRCYFNPAGLWREVEIAAIVSIFRASVPAW